MIISAELRAHIDRLVAEAPPLSPRQIAGLRAALIPGERQITYQAA